MFLYIFIHSNYFFQTITQSFYIALSHINIRTSKKVSADVLIMRRRCNYPRGRNGAVGGRERKRTAVSGWPRKKISKKSHSAENCRTVPKIVAQCRK